MKEVNRYTSNEFHDWQRVNLPKNFVMQDVDTWALVWSEPNNNYEPIGIIELKRSRYYSPERWTPFPEDIENFLALKKLADKAGIPFFIIYFEMGKEIISTTKLHIFKIINIDPKATKKIEYVDKIVTADEFKKDFPSALLR